MDDYIDQWTELQDQIDALKARQTVIAEKLMENMSVGEVWQSKAGNKIRKCDRGNLIPDKLREAVTPQMWVKITERKPVAVLYKAKVKEGKLNQSVLDGATERTKPWLEKR